MKIENHVYTVSLDIEECRYICTALHSMYKSLQETEEKTPALCEKIGAVRSLRSSFSNLCGINYMGADA